MTIKLPRLGTPDVPEIPYTNIDDKFEETLALLIKTFNAKLTSVEKTVNRQIDSANKKYNDLKDDRDAFVAGLRAEAQKGIDALKKQHESALGKLQDQHDSAIGKIQDQWDSAVGKYESVIDARDETIADLKAKLIEAGKDAGDIISDAGDVLKDAGQDAWDKLTLKEEREEIKSFVKTAAIVGGIVIAGVIGLSIYMIMKNKSTIDGGIALTKDLIGDEIREARNFDMLRETQRSVEGTRLISQGVLAPADESAKILEAHEKALDMGMRIGAAKATGGISETVRAGAEGVKAAFAGAGSGTMGAGELGQRASLGIIAGATPFLIPAGMKYIKGKMNDSGSVEETPAGEPEPIVVKTDVDGHNAKIVADTHEARRLTEKAESMMVETFKDHDATHFGVKVGDEEKWVSKEQFVDSKISFDDWIDKMRDDNSPVQKKIPEVSETLNDRANASIMDQLLSEDDVKDAKVEYDSEYEHGDYQEFDPMYGHGRAIGGDKRWGDAPIIHPDERDKKVFIKPNKEPGWVDGKPNFWDGVKWVQKRPPEHDFWDGKKWVQKKDDDLPDYREGGI